MNGLKQHEPPIWTYNTIKTSIYRGADDLQEEVLYFGAGTFISVSDFWCLDNLVGVQELYFISVLLRCCSTAEFSL